jgi:ATP-dependent RNA helicase DeaD
VHRIGRTGRAGRSGDAISFVTPRERYLLRHLEKANGTPLVQMSLPSVDDVNSTRLARFDDRITQALEERSRIEGFREVIAHYVREHDVPEVDVAAALAVVAQGDEPLLLQPEPQRERPQRDRDPRPATGFATYRIDVGRKHRVEPRQIVGALANEGGLNRRDFGAITIRSDFSLVELPAELPREAWDGLKDTRIGGRPIKLRKDSGRPGRPHRGDEAPAREKKPRHRKQ